MFQDTGGLAREIQRAGLAEAEQPHVLPVTRTTGRRLNVDRADIRRFDEDLAHRHLLVGVLMRILQQVLAIFAPPWHDERGVGAHNPAVEASSHGDDLGHRSRFVDVDRGMVARGDLHLSGSRAAFHRRHGEQIAGVRLHHDAGSGLRPNGAHLSDEGVFAGELHRPVKGQHQVIAGRCICGHGLGAGDRAPTRCHLSGHRTGCAGEKLVVPQLQPGDPHTVDVGEPDDRAAGIATGQDAARFVIDIYATQPKFRELRTDRGIDLPAHVYESAILGFHLGEEALLFINVEPKHRCQHRQCCCRVLDELGVDRHRGRRNRHGQFFPVAIKDRPAVGGDHGRSRPLVCSRNPVLITVTGLDVDHANAEQCQEADDRADHDAQPTPMIGDSET